MAARTIFTVTLVLTAHFLSKTAVTGDNSGTTPHLQEIFLGRCWDYKLTKYPDMPQVNANCNELWNTFFSSLAYRPPCSLAQNSYSAYMEMAGQAIPENRALFWSGTSEISHDLADDAKRYVTLEDTLIGYLANKLIFCGQEESPGLNYFRCPLWEECPQEVSELFWASASSKFASSVKGQVAVVISGSRADKPAYSKDSFFAKFELPNLHDVTMVNIMVVHSLTEPSRENCTSGSILQLKADIAARKLPFTCEDNPHTIQHLLCADNPSSSHCALVSAYMSSDRKAAAANERPKLVNNKPDRFCE